MFFSLVFGIDEDVIKVYYHKNIELFYQNLINVALKCSRYIDQCKKHYLILEIIVAGFESHFSFISFSDLHLIIDLSQVKLGKIPS